MSDDTEQKHTLGTFITRFSTPITAILAFITSVYGFLKLFTDKDVGLVAVVSLAVGLLLLFGLCLYYARFWQPEKGDKGRSAFAPALGDDAEKAQAQKVKRRKLVRRSAIGGLVLIPLLVIGGVGGWLYVQNLPTNDVIIMVAEFEGPDAQNYRVTSTIYEQLREATADHKEVKVKLLGKAISEKEGSEVARKEGQQQKASILIWGWYGKTKETVPISVNFELLKPPAHFPKLGADVQGKVQTAQAAELESFKLQTHLSGEMAYLTLVTLGMSKYVAADWDGAIADFSEALGQVKEPVPALTQTTIYFLRGVAYTGKQAYDRAIADYTQTIKLKPDYAEAYNNRGNVYGEKQAYDKAIADFTQAIKLKPDDALAYYNRGLAYAHKQAYDQAIADYTQAIEVNQNWGSFSANYHGLPSAYVGRGNAYYKKQAYDQGIADYTQAIKLKPDYALAYDNRGIAYAHKQAYDQAIADYTQAIKLKPDDAWAYENRGYAYYNKKEYDKAIADYTQALKLKPDYALAYNGRGIAYRHKGEQQSAIQDFKQALKLTQDPDTRKDAAQNLKALGVH